ncbi:hypothetical protein N6H14_15345 [Paenibacillus sp. CC-CFT747]|nr:hypothetical protein N6H14_15345 [Paenibacillus sp. CC-CFT747]
MFLIHYSLLAILLLEEAEREKLAAAYGPFFGSYEDDCPVVNTNCAALQWGTERYLDTLGYRQADGGKAGRLLAFVEKAQLESGFINDEVTEQGAEDGMPIAYHAFTLFIITGVLAGVGEEALPEESKASVHRVMQKGLAWIGHTVTLDGSFAMVERSSYQTFTWGAFTALCAYSGFTGETADDLLRRAVDYWLPFRHSDGTFGCTPNHLPHSLRAGYETYTHLNMYNLLGLTGLAVAGRLLERGLRLEVSDAAEVRDRGIADAAENWERETAAGKDRLLAQTEKEPLADGRVKEERGIQSEGGNSREPAAVSGESPRLPGVSTSRWSGRMTAARPRWRWRQPDTGFLRGTPSSTKPAGMRSSAGETTSSAARCGCTTGGTPRRCRAFTSGWGDAPPPRGAPAARQRQP